MDDTKRRGPQEWGPGFITAWRTLTVIPIPGEEAGHLAAALKWFPMVGFILATIMLGLARIFTFGAGNDWPMGTAVLLTVASVALTGGLHIDGVADWADAFWQSRTRERTLAIMKDSRVGAYGLMAVVCVLLAKFVCIARLVAHDEYRWIVAALMLSRCVQVALAVRHPYARTDGGTAESFVGDAEPRDVKIAAGSTLILMVCFGGLQAGWVVAILACLALGWGFGNWCQKRVGGMTGDLLGTAGELSEILVLFVGAGWFVPGGGA